MTSTSYEEACEQERVLRKLLEEGRANSDELDELERFMKRVLDPKKVEEEKTERKRRSSKVMIEEKIQTPSLPDDVDSMHASIERDIMKQNIPMYVPYSIKYESYSRASRSKYRRAHTHKKK